MTYPTSIPTSIGQSATLACVLEASAHKPGNVHRGADFEDMSYLDMIIAAVAIAPALENAARTGVGPAALRAVELTQTAVGKNTNLGTILLLAPLAAAVPSGDLRSGVRDQLSSLGSSDAEQIYSAIRRASPVGLGSVNEADVLSEQAPNDIVAAMRLASDRDMVARQYAYDFEDVFDFVLPIIEQSLGDGVALLDAIVFAHVRTMAEYPDSLIARKNDGQVAQESADRAARVIAEGRPGDAGYHGELAELDFWLRCDGHRRNPGTTADLIAAAIFVGLCEQRFSFPIP